MKFVGSGACVVCVVETRDRWHFAGDPATRIFLVARAADDDAGSLRYASFGAQISEEPGTRLDRFLDLSEGALERSFVEQAVERGTVACRWEPHGMEAERELDDVARGRLAEVLTRTRGIGHAAWQDEIAEVAGRDHWWSFGEGTGELASQVASPPETMVPFFAGRSGAVPPAGSPVIAGVALPPGDRCGGPVATYWATFDEIAHPSELMAPLVRAFQETGLWPLCWGWRQDEVDTLFREPPITRDEIAAVEVEALARRCWEDRAFSPSVIGPLDTAFPGLAGPSTAVPELDGPFDIVDEKMGWQDVAGRQILLVPCNRPADALGVIAWEGQRLSCAEICATLRSWEERFAAVPIGLDAWGATLLVGAPPVTDEQALRLAAELAAVTTVEDMYEAGDLSRLAKALVHGGTTSPGEFTPRHWRLNLDD